MVLLITCALEIPVLLLGGLIDDRRELSSDVKEELATSWGGTLEVDVPQLCVPFFMNSTDKDGKTVKELKLRKAKSSATEVMRRSMWKFFIALFTISRYIRLMSR